MVNFLQQRRIEKDSERFWELMEQGEIPAALEHYETSLADYGADVEKPVRAAYHFHRWLAHRSEDDLRAVEMLASGEAANSQIARAAHIMRRFRRETELGNALRQRNPDLLVAPHEQADFQLAERLEDLTSAVLEVYRLRQRHDKSVVAAHIQWELPPAAELPSELWRVWNHLYLWAAWNRGHYAHLLDNPTILQLLPQDERRDFTEAAIYAWGDHALSWGERITGALAALRRARSLAREERVHFGHLASMILRWAVRALEEKRGDNVIAWLTHNEVQEVLTESAASSWERQLILALAYFQKGKHNLGQETLHSLIATEPGPEIKTQARYLHALSLLAETKSWERSGEGKQEGGDVRLETMWRNLRSKLESVAAELSAAPTSLAWRGDLLIGLIAYVDSEATPTLPQLEKFGAAVEQVESRQARRKLATIEGELLTRARATDEAVEYIRRRAYAELRALQDQVLAPLGDAIPAQVRAAVYMTLWEGDPGYDPLPDLQRIPLPGGDDPTTALVTACMDQVQAAKTMEQLAHLLGQPRVQQGTQVPALTPLSFDDDVAEMGSLAVAVFRLRQELWQQALSQLPPREEGSLSTGEDDAAQMAAYVRFYAGWKLDDLDICLQNAPNRFLERAQKWHTAVDGRRLLSALEEGKAPVVLEALHLSDGSEMAVEHLIGATGWLLQHDRAEQALTLCRMVEENLPEEGLESDVHRWLPFLQGMGAAQAGQFTTAIDAFEQYLSGPAPSNVDSATARQLQGLAHLFRLDADLALVSVSQDDLATRWPAVRRSLAEQAEALQETPELQAYGDLIGGLVTYLTADTLVDEATIERLQRARQALHLKRHSRFLEDVLGRLRWRREILNDFWTGLHQGDLKKSRDIFLREIKPVFGDRVPSAIRLAMVIVDWDTGTYTTEDLLRRLSILEHDAPDLNPEIIEQVREYIQDADRTRRFTELVQRKDYDAIIQFVEQSEWAKGMTAPVAIALLHALYKKKRHEAARRFGSQITDRPIQAGWVRDYGYLILGYLLYDNEEYDEAAAAFEKIGVSELLGKHNTDQYWAASHFARGLQYLEGDKREEAFDSFRRSLSHMQAREENVSLARLFIYFGLQNLEGRKGNRARQAFTLLKESVEGLEPSPDVVKSSVLGEMGLLLCDGLLDGEGDGLPTGEDFVQLRERVSEREEFLPKEEQLLMKHALGRLAICQELRHERRTSSRRHRTKKDLRDYVSTQVEALEALPAFRGGHDPVILVVKGLIHTRLKDRRDVDQALEYLTEAARLGLSTPKFNALFHELTESRQRDLESRSIIIDLFDLYLLSGALPPALREHLRQTGEVVELYRARRGYMPEEVARSYVKSPVAITEERIEHLKKVVQSSPLAEDDTIKGLLDELEKKLQELQGAEEALMAREKDVITAVAGQMEKKDVETI
ncbi:MAG: hypothetical protein ACP5GX_00710 [Anaerolineae bacterium]